MSSALPSTCVIGAGSSGIAVVKALAEHGLPFDCFERGSEVGGLWVYENPNGLSGAYQSLVINTPKQRMQFSDFPMPKEYPDFPHHGQIRAYFDAYVDHFRLRPRITFNCPVEHARRRADGVWEVTLAGGGTREYDALVVANGHHWDPRWPEPPFPGSFAGLQMHSHAYRENSILRGKRVVVVGMGNSAMDIAVEASQVAERTFLAARRGAHVIPKYILGRPYDLPLQPLRSLLFSPRLPWRFRRWAQEKVLQLTVGSMQEQGLPPPDHRLLEAHPTLSSGIFQPVREGRITVKPNLAELLGRRVRFADGSLEEVDVIVYCTGYRVSFPFFDPDFISAPDNELPLFRRVFKPEVKNVFFAGLLQPLGAVMPIVEAQGYWIADYLEGRYALPPEDEMRAEIERDRERRRRRFVASKRHTMEVDFDDYLYQLKAERKRGQRRAARRGYRRPVPARARQLPATPVAG